VAFEFRLVDLDRYRSACRSLDRAGAGDVRELQGLVGRALEQLDGEPFQRWNSNVAWWTAWLRARLERARGGLGPADLAEVAGPILALESMPGFQLSPHSPAPASPAFAWLGEDDGRLYEALAARSAWLPDLLMVAFHQRSEPHRIRGAMVLLDREEVRRLREQVRDLGAPAVPEPGFTTALARLEHLLDEALAHDRLGVAVISNP